MRGNKPFRPVHDGIRDALKNGTEVAVFTLDISGPRVIKSKGCRSIVLVLKPG